MDQLETVFQVKVTLTLTFDPKINRVHLLLMINQSIKIEKLGSKGSQVIDRKPFFS